MASSGTTLFQPSITDIVVEAYSRIQIRGPELTTEHMIEARRTLNLLLQDWSGNRSVNLWKVELDYMPLIPGQSEYGLPTSLIQLLDIYLRTVTITTTSSVSIGSVLTPVFDQTTGVPVITQFGEPIVSQTGSQTFTTIAGNPVITMTWAIHGLSVGDAFQFVMPTVAGGVQLSSLNFVESVVDANTLTFFSPSVPTVSETGTGFTPLFSTTNASRTITVYYLNHGLDVGDAFTVPVSTTVGGVTLSGSYTAITVPNSYSFTITAAAAATSSTCAFENGGRIAIYNQSTTIEPSDNIMYGISRTEYASIPDKVSAGQPTTFWFERKVSPRLHIWQVPAAATTFGVGIYSMKQIQDASPSGGQTPDLPNRMLPVLCAELAAGLAEKYRPEAFASKMQLAQTLWMRAAMEDVEDVPLFITPGLSGYYN